MTTISLAETCGPVISGRSRAREIREDVERRLDAGDDVVLDFGGIVTMSPSAGDEIFAKLQREHLSFANLSEGLQSLENFVVASRNSGA